MGASLRPLSKGNVRGYAIAKRGSMSIYANRDGAHCVSCVRLTQGHYCLGWITSTIGKITQCAVVN